MVTKDKIKKLRSLLQSGADADFFFTSIKTASWLPALMEGGFFSAKPPDPVTGDGWVRHPPWPESRYLARVAKLSPDTAATAALSIPETSNAGVNEDIIEVALAVTPQSAAKLMPRISRWIKKSDLHRLNDEIGKVMAHAANGGAIGTVFSLLEWLIEFSSDDSASDGGDNPFAWGNDPKTRLKSHEYQRVLGEALPTLLRLKPVILLEILSKTLAQYCKLRHSPEMPEGYDGSLYWRPSIAEHSQNSRFDEITHLVGTLRASGEEAVKAETITIEQLFSIIEKHPWDIFRRFELHFARIYASRTGQGKVRRLVMTEDYVRDGRAPLEYGLLLHDVYPTLEAGDRETILAWVEQGPLEKDLAWMRQGDGEELATADLLEARINQWRVKRLYWIKDQLPATWLERYEKWTAGGKEPLHPGFDSWMSGGTVGTVSPIKSEEFHRLKISDQLAYVSTWVPPAHNWMGPSRGGLAGILQLEIKADPVPYFEASAKFRGLAPEYVNALFSGFRESLKVQTVSSWQSFWLLAQWIVEQPDPVVEILDEFTGRIRSGRRWQYIRLELARFIDAALRGETIALPSDQRESVWTIIEALATDPSPAISDDDDATESSMDSYSLSANTVRGEAIHSIFSYIRWCRTPAMAATEATEALADVPEADRVLTAHLSPEIEPTRTVRSVYGANTAYLAEWASAWLNANRTRIFPTDGPHRLRTVAWETFVIYSQPSRRTFELLHDEFARAVRRMEKLPDVDKRNDPRVNLGRHIVVNYWWGNFELETPGNLLADFFGHAPEDIRAEVLAFVGRSLRDLKGELPEAIRARLMKLWLWRLEAASKADGNGFHEEMEAFAWWFDSRQFDEEWAATNMVQALELSTSRRNHFLWMKLFAEIAERRPREAIRALELTVEAAQAGSIAFWDDTEATTILKAVWASNDTELRGKAQRVRSILLKMGRKQFLSTIPAE